MIGYVEEKYYELEVYPDDHYNLYAFTVSRTLTAAKLLEDSWKVIITETNKHKVGKIGEATQDLGD